MNESKISVRYAKALFLSSLEKGILEPIWKDIVVIDGIIHESETFESFLSSPINIPSAKIRFINNVFANGIIHSMTLNFLNLLVQNNRAIYISGITRHFIHLYHQHKGIKSAVFVSAVQPDESLSQRIQKVLQEAYKAEIDLKIQTDSTLIGGFILRVGDQQYDASVATALRRIKSKLLLQH